MATPSRRRPAAGLVVVFLLALGAGCSDDSSSRDGDSGADLGTDSADSASDATADLGPPDTPGDPDAAEDPASDVPGDAPDAVDADALDLLDESPPDAAADADAADVPDAADAIDIDADSDSEPDAAADADVDADAGGGPCDAQDAVGSGVCDDLLGWSWDGDACRTVRGCDCTGAACDALAAAREACEEAHVECVFARTYELLVISPLEGHEYATPLAMNDAGVVVGSSGPEPFSNVAEAAWVMLPATALESLAVPEVSFGYARGVDEAGVIVGENQFQPQVWVEGARSPLGVPDGWFSGVARDIGEDGTIVGTFADYDDALPPNPIGPRPCVWPSLEAAPVPLATLGEEEPLGYAVALNEAGEIAGSLSSPEGFVAALWASAEATPEPLPLPEGASSAEGHGLNAHGDVVGRAAHADFHSTAFLYRREADATESLPFPEGVTAEIPYAEAWAVRDDGVVVGTASAPGGGVRAVLWYGGEVRDLTEAVAEPPEGVRYLLTATALDGTGRIGVEVVLEGAAPDTPRTVGILVETAGLSLHSRP